MHVATVTFRVLVKKDDLVQLMLGGWKEVEPGRARSATGDSPLAFVLTLLLALAAVYAGSGDWMPTATPVTPTAAAGW